MLHKKTIRDINVSGKTVLVRVDFNVPLDGLIITDDTRIKAAVPTINYLLEKQAAVILASHLGRPRGKFNRDLSLAPVAEYLSNILGTNVVFVNDCFGPKAIKAASDLSAGEILMLENTRFYPGEKKNDPVMGKKLASLADIFINDAFGTAHRAHASNVGVADYLPAAAGLLLEKEIIYLGNAISNPERPFTAILGGAKVSGKIAVIENLIEKVDWILIGGGMANTFFAAQGFKLGDSLVEEDSIGIAEEILSKAGDKLLLPGDVIIADRFEANAEYKEIQMNNVPDRWRIMDLGKNTLHEFGKIIKLSKTIVWNGPMGVFEFPAFAEGTYQLAKLIADSDAVSIIGGGDSAAAIAKAGLSDQITHISTGGGASLQMLEGKPLPGLIALDEK
ncbi:MAG: phosphoglycerate kinase [Candidatus Heimdallarchaeota archaeon]|nr:phosphoglycerate kinase [Candidatus Heimdallarchaeota archaeon]